MHVYVSGPYTVNHVFTTCYLYVYTTDDVLDDAELKKQLTKSFKVSK